MVAFFIVFVVDVVVVVVVFVKTHFRFVVPVGKTNICICWPHFDEFDNEYLNEFNVLREFSLKFFSSLQIFSDHYNLDEFKFSLMIENSFLWNRFYSPDFFRSCPRHLVQPGQPDPSRGPDVEQPPSGRIPRRFHSSHPGTFPGHFWNGVRVGDGGQVDVQIIIWEAFNSVKRHQTEAKQMSPILT